MGIRVLVSGSGKMGREVLAAVCLADDLEPAGVVALFAKADAIALPDGSGAHPRERSERRVLRRVGRPRYGTRPVLSAGSVQFGSRGRNGRRWR